MREIEVALVGADACISFWSALERVCRVGGVEARGTPRNSAEDVPLDRVKGEPASLIVADLPALVAARPGATAGSRGRPRGLGTLQAWSEWTPRPTVVLYTPSLAAVDVRALAAAGVDELIALTEEDYPRAVQRALTRVLLPTWVTDFVESFPPRALPLEVETAVQGFLLHPEGASPERSLAERSGRDVHKIHREFARGGLPSPGAVCALGLLYGVARKEMERKGGGRAWLRAAGLGWDEVRAWCPSDFISPKAIVEGGDADLALKAFRDALRNRRVPERADPGADDPPDREAIEHIYSEHIEAMVSLGVTLGLPPEDAEDVGHQTFVRLLRSGKQEVGRR